MRYIENLPKFLLMAAIFSSCSVPFTISVHQDGSATVQTSGIPLSELKPHYQSNIISRIDTSGFELSFDIKTIDSLGNYLPIVQKGFFQFSYDSSSFTLTDGHGTAFKENHWSCCHVGMLIKFEQEIKELKSENKIAQKKSNYSVQISKNRRQILKGKTKINLTVKF